MIPAAPTSTVPSPYATDQSASLQQYLRNGLPDWDAISDDVCCSRCGYNLRTLTRPLCPECGLEFAWSDVLVRTFTESDFLIEHQWRRKPVRAMLLTIFLSFFPRRFWRRISIHAPIHRRPLVFTWLFTVCVFLCAILLTTAAGWLVTDYVDALENPPPPPRPGPNSPPAAWTAWFTTTSNRSELRKVSDAFHDLMLLAIDPRETRACLPLYWTCVFPGTMLVLCGLWQTRGAFRIRREQMMRVAVYGLIPGAAVSGFIFSAWYVVQVVLPPIYFGSALGWVTIAGKILVLAFALSMFLRVGLRDYLKIPHAGWVAFTAALAGVLLAMGVTSTFMNYRVNIGLLFG